MYLILLVVGLKFESPHQLISRPPHHVWHTGLNHSKELKVFVSQEIGRNLCAQVKLKGRMCDSYLLTDGMSITKADSDYKTSRLCESIFRD